MIYSYIYLSFINFNIFKLTNKQEARFKTYSRLLLWYYKNRNTITPKTIYQFIIL